MSTEREVALGMVVTKWAADRIVPGIKTLRDTGKNDLIPGESVAAVSPVNGEVLGKVTRTKPKPVASVEDEAALLAYVAETDPEALRDVDVITGSHEKVVEALKESHPHLVSQTVKVVDYALNALLKKAEGDKEFRPPGIKVETPVGTVNIYPAKDMDEHFEAVIKSGAVALDGTIRPELPSGDAA